jgi:hypothetical protein
VPRRQVAIFRIGCYLAFVAAALHMVGHLQGPQPPANDTERQLIELATTYRIQMPGGGARSYMEFLNGFSLTLALFLATLGGVGLMVARRSSDDPALMLAIARTLAAASVVLLVISLTHFFIIPTICIASFAVCFATASVRPPGV